MAGFIMGVLDWAAILSATIRKMATFYESIFFKRLDILSKIFFLDFLSKRPALKHRDPGKISNVVSKSSLGILVTTQNSSPTKNQN